MIPRGVLDIDAATLLRTAIRSVFPLDADRIAKSAESQWDTVRPVMACQSVRSGFDAVLGAMKWSAGDEILMSAATIADMPRIVREHGLVPVPIDVSQDSLALDIDQLQSRITPRSRAILVAHLFGSRLDLEPVSRIAKQHGIALWEDVAQGYAADCFPGDKLVDISFFSFGTIKTQTALGGAICRFRDPDIASRCRDLQSQWPVQSTNRFRKKLAVAATLQVLNRHSIFTLLTSLSSSVSFDIDGWLSRSVRGYRPDQLFKQLRHRPCGSQMDLLHRRLIHRATKWLKAKDGHIRQYSQLLMPELLLGAKAIFPVRWVFPIVSRNPPHLVERLRRLGFDATVRGSRLQTVAAPDEYPEWNASEAERWLPRLVFLPLHPSLRAKHIQTMANAINHFEAERC